MRDELVERMARAIAAGLGDVTGRHRWEASAALRAIEEAGAVVVPRELLEFYGDQERWTAYSSDERAGVSNRSFGSEFGLDEGQRARNALAASPYTEKGERG